MPNITRAEFQKYLSPTLMAGTEKLSTSSKVGRIFSNIGKKAAAKFFRIVALFTKGEWINNKAVMNLMDKKIVELTQNLKQHRGKDIDRGMIHTGVQEMKATCRDLKKLGVNISKLENDLTGLENVTISFATEVETMKTPVEQPVAEEPNHAEEPKHAERGKLSELRSKRKGDKQPGVSKLEKAKADLQTLEEERKARMHAKAEKVKAAHVEPAKPAAVQEKPAEKPHEHAEKPRAKEPESPGSAELAQLRAGREEGETVKPEKGSLKKTEHPKHGAKEAEEPIKSGTEESVRESTYEWYGKAEKQSGREVGLHARDRSERMPVEDQVSAEEPDTSVRKIPGYAKEPVKFEKPPLPKKPEVTNAPPLADVVKPPQALKPGAKPGVAGAPISRYQGVAVPPRAETSQNILVATGKMSVEGMRKFMTAKIETLITESDTVIEADKLLRVNDLIKEISQSIDRKEIEQKSTEALNIILNLPSAPSQAKPVVAEPAKPAVHAAQPHVPAQPAVQEKPVAKPAVHVEHAKPAAKKLNIEADKAVFLKDLQQISTAIAKDVYEGRASAHKRLEPTKIQSSSKYSDIKNEIEDAITILEGAYDKKFRMPPSVKEQIERLMEKVNNKFEQESLHQKIEAGKKVEMRESPKHAPEGFRSKGYGRMESAPTQEQEFGIHRRDAGARLPVEEQVSEEPVKIPVKGSVRFAETIQRRDKFEKAKSEKGEELLTKQSIKNEGKPVQIAPELRAARAEKIGGKAVRLQQALNVAQNRTKSLLGSVKDDFKAALSKADRGIFEGLASKDYKKMNRDQILENLSRFETLIDNLNSTIRAKKKIGESDRALFDVLSGLQDGIDEIRNLISEKPETQAKPDLTTADSDIEDAFHGEAFGEIDVESSAEGRSAAKIAEGKKSEAALRHEDHLQRWKKTEMQTSPKHAPEETFRSKDDSLKGGVSAKAPQADAGGTHRTYAGPGMRDEGARLPIEEQGAAEPFSGGHRFAKTIQSKETLEKLVETPERGFKADFQRAFDFAIKKGIISSSAQGRIEEMIKNSSRKSFEKDARGIVEEFISSTHPTGDKNVDAERELFIRSLDQQLPDNYRETIKENVKNLVDNFVGSAQVKVALGSSLPQFVRAQGTDITRLQELANLDFSVMSQDKIRESVDEIGKKISKTKGKISGEEFNKFDKKFKEIESNLKKGISGKPIGFEKPKAKGRPKAVKRPNVSEVSKSAKKSVLGDIEKESSKLE